MNQHETLLSPDVIQFNQLSCLKLFCQINLIGTAINMDETEKNNSNTQWITGTALNLTFEWIKWSTDRCISSGNGTEWSPIRSETIRMINQIGRDVSRPIWLTILMISDQRHEVVDTTFNVRRHEVLLSIHHKYYTFRLLYKGQKIFWVEIIIHFMILVNMSAIKTFKS